MAISLRVNGATRSVDAEPDTPLLYVLRNDLELNGAKYGCAMTQCGACTVLVNGAARRSCVTPVGSIEGNGSWRRPISSTAIRNRRRRTCGQRSPTISAAAAPTIESSARCYVQQRGRHETWSRDRRNVGGAMNTKRRDFLKSAGGIAVAFSWSVPTVLAQQATRPALPGSLGTNRMLDGWIRVNPAGTITVFTGKCELGQGILTALAQIAAEELDVAYERVEIVSADTARTPNEGMTAGSLSVENSGTALRLACAEARQILLQLAATKLGVAVADLSVSDGTVIGAGKLTYWELAREVNLEREASAQAKPKPPAQHRIVGRNIQRRDIPAKVTGGAAFVQDLRLPGMVHGRVVRPPSYGARLDSFDEAKVKAMPGVIALVRDGSFLGVVAQREEQAINARLVLIASAKWSGGSELPDPAKLYEQLMSLRSEDRVISEKDAPVPAGAKVIEATYHRPYQAHAAIAPSCAVAEHKDGKLTVWTHSQGVFPLRATIARALGMEPSDIRCVHAEGAGCYGHNGADDVAFDAALLARTVNGRPVRLQWMRDEEFKWEPYGPAMTMKVKGAVADGRVVDWAYDVWSQSHNMRPGDPDGINLLGSWYLADAKRPGPARHAAQPNGAGDRNAITLYDFPRQRAPRRCARSAPTPTCSRSSPSWTSSRPPPASTPWRSASRTSRTSASAP
jgi:nicotinate dehydrogenase subunit B